MGKYLDFDNEEKGYEPFTLNSKNVKANKGRQICFVNKRKVCPHRGYYNVEFGVLDSTYYSTLFLNEGEISVDMRDIAECGIEIESNL